MQNRSHGSSSLAEEAPPPTQCKHTHIEASTVSLFTTRTKNFNSPDTLYTAFINSDSVSFTKTQARYTILLPPPPPPPEQRPDWQAASSCHILPAGRFELRRIQGAPTLRVCIEQRTRHYNCAGPNKGEKPETPETDSAVKADLSRRSYNAHQRLFRERQNLEHRTRESATRAQVPRRHIRRSTTKKYRRSRVLGHIEASLRARDTEHNGINLQLLTFCEASIVRVGTQRAITVEGRKSKRRDRFLEGKKEAVPPTAMMHTESSFAKRVLEKLS